MEKLGEYLKAAREKKGRSLSEMAERTRISLSFLQALENDEYSAIPGDVFVSGFLRSYARELGLSQKDVMARFRQAMGEEKAGQPVETPMPPVLKKVMEKERPLKLVYAGAAVFALLVAVYLLTGREHGEQTLPAPEAPAVKQAVEAPVEAPERAEPAPARETVPEEDVSAAKEEAGVRLKLTATADTWFHLRADGVRTKDAILRPGESVVVEADREIFLDLGNAGGVEIEYNGKTIKPLGPPGAVRRNLLFTPTQTPEPLGDRTLGAA